LLKLRAKIQRCLSSPNHSPDLQLAASADSFIVIRLEISKSGTIFLDIKKVDIEFGAPERESGKCFQSALKCKLFTFTLYFKVLLYR